MYSPSCQGCFESAKRRRSSLASPKPPPDNLGPRGPSKAGAAGAAGKLGGLGVGRSELQANHTRWPGKQCGLQFYCQTGLTLVKGAAARWGHARCLLDRSRMPLSLIALFSAPATKRHRRSLLPRASHHRHPPTRPTNGSRGTAAPLAAAFPKGHRFERLSRDDHQRGSILYLSPAPIPSSSRIIPGAVLCIVSR